MSNFNKVFNPKFISLIIICVILLTNTAYGIDLSKESYLRKPLDFNNANKDGRFHGVLSKIAGSKHNGAAEPIKSSINVTFDKSYMDKVATMEGLREFKYYLQDSLKDQDFVHDTIKKLELVSKDTHIVDIEIEELHEKAKIVFLITLKDRNGSSVQFIIYYIDTFSAKGYKRAEDEMRKDPSLKIFPKVGIENDPGLNRILLSVEYIKPLTEDEAEHFTPSQKSMVLITAVFKMLNKGLYLHDELFKYKQYSFTIGANGMVEAKILDLDSLITAQPHDITYEVDKIFEYLNDHRVDIMPETKDRILAALKIGSGYIESTNLIDGYANFIAHYSDPSLPSIAQVKEIVKQSAANPAAGRQIELILNSKGQTFDQVWGDLKKKGELYPEYFIDPRDWLVDVQEERFAKDYAQMSIKELEGVFINLISGGDEAAIASSEWMLKFESPLRVFIDSLSDPMEMAHHFRSPASRIDFILSATEVLRKKGTLSKDREERYQNMLINGYRYKAFIRALTKRWNNADGHVKDVDSIKTSFSPGANPAVSPDTATSEIKGMLIQKQSILSSSDH